MDLTWLHHEPVFFAKLLAVSGSFIAMMTDMKWGKIFNWLTFPLIFLGFAINSYGYGWSGFGNSLGASILGISFYMGFALMGAMGMGDVKLMAAIGALGGVKYVVSAFLYTSVIGIPHALIVHGMNHGRNSLSMILTSYTTGVFLEKNIQNDNASLKYHYYLGLDIFCGTILAWLFEIPLGY